MTAYEAYAPKDRDDAERTDYAVGVPFAASRRFNPKRCAFRILAGTGHYTYQCSRHPGHGPHDLFCKQHAAVVERQA